MTALMLNGMDEAFYLFVCSKQQQTFQGLFLMTVQNPSIDLIPWPDKYQINMQYKFYTKSWSWNIFIQNGRALGGSE